MKLISHSARNIFSIDHLDLDLDDLGLVQVTGWSYDEGSTNMAGKSSVANRSILWSLYGKTADGIKGDDVINTSSKNKTCSTKTLFQGIDNEIYKITRLRPSRLTLEKRYNKGWRDISGRRENDTQQRINQALGRDFKTFIQADLFGQGREKSFLSLPGREQKEIIEEILPLNDLQQWQDNAKKDIIKYMQELEEAKQILFSNVTKKDILKDQINSFNKQKTDWEVNNTLTISAKEKELRGLRGINDEINNQITVLLSTFPDGLVVDNLLDMHNNRHIDLASEIAELNIRLINDKNTLEKLINKSNFCITCGQILPEEVIDKVDNEVEILNNSIESDEQLLKTKKSELDKIVLEASKLTKIKELENKKKDVSKISVLEAELYNLKNITSPFTEILRVHQKKEKEIIQLEEQSRKNVNKIKEKLDHLKFWENAFSKDLKTLLFEKVCPFLEQRSNQYLSELNNRQIKVSFSTFKELKSGDVKDDLSVTAKSKTGGKTYSLFSGAEKQLTSFAVGLALSDLASLQAKGSSKFMILDEPFLYQGPENCENIVNFITQKLGDKKSTILLISNEENLQGLIPKQIHVIKRGGMSIVDQRSI